MKAVRRTHSLLDLVLGAGEDRPRVNFRDGHESSGALGQNKVFLD